MYLLKFNNVIDNLHMGLSDEIRDIASVPDLILNHLLPLRGVLFLVHVV